MGAVSIYELTNILPFVWELADDRAEVAKEVVNKEFVKVLLELLVSKLRSARRWLTVGDVFIDFFSQIFAHMHSICEAMINWI